jgi:Hypothetical glycosyl hydrolase 6/Beta-galactosidase trimerisation domain
MGIGVGLAIRWIKLNVPRMEVFCKMQVVATDYNTGMSWYKKTYRRNVIDMHITDHDPRFLTEFDADRYVDMLVRSQVQSTVLYAHSHVGLCYFHTKVGPMHKGLHGRDIFGEVVERCRQHGIAVVGYYSLIYDTWAYRNNPDWGIIGMDGKGVADKSRYGVCCPNSPYSDRTMTIVRELCANYDLQGIRFDMTFWPTVCYCQYCQKRFADATGAPLPTVINWEDPMWVSFARQREAWLVEFASLMTHTVKQVKPNLTVEHQSSTYSAPWLLGVTTELAAQNDFLQGDFYGDALQGSFVRKLFYNLTPNRPSAFETSIGVSLDNYTALKSRELLEAKAYAALADGSAFVYIDSIDPAGTLNPAVFERMGDIFNHTKAYEPYIGGDLCQDVAVYFSTESKCDFSDNGKAVNDSTLTYKTPHLYAAVSVCQSLIDNHIPFGVITRKNLDCLSRYSIIVLPNVLMMADDEVTALREYVRQGGRLYASKYTSLILIDGHRLRDFMLAEVFGVSYQGETKEKFTYIAPVQDEDKLFASYTRKHPAGMWGTQLIIQAHPKAKILGEQVLPYTDPADPVHFASIHNNPPGIYTGRPAIVANSFGQGKTLYVTVNIENTDPHRAVFISLLRQLMQSFSIEALAPKSVEITLFHQAESCRYIINLVNFQKELPNIPVDNIEVRIRLDGKKPIQLLRLPEGQPVEYVVRSGYACFTAPRLHTFAMYALEYEA